MKIIKIIAKKHDASFHRSWQENTLLSNNENAIIGLNNKTKVIHNDSSTMVTKNRALFYFPKNKWFNIIHIDKPNNPYYYCNISSPIKIQNKDLIYIDYDIDIIVDRNYNYQILDMDEFEVNRALYNYSEELEEQLKNSIKELIDIIKNKQLIFSNKELEYYYNLYEVKKRRKFD